jgi:excisionase family DNA binding protein
MAPEKWFSIQEAADFLGISTVTLRRYIKNHRISAYRIAGRYRFKEKALEDFIEACRLEPLKKTISSPGHDDVIPDDPVEYLKTLDSTDHLADAVIQDAPRQSRSLFIKAFAASRLGRYEEAEACYRRIIDKRPGDGAAYFFLGLLYQEMKKQDQALQMWRQVVKIDRASDLAEVARYHITRALRDG